MKTWLLPKEGNDYKANLHCHSTVSDGKLTPEELKTEYKKRGYSIIAYTDHDRLVGHSDLNDPDFLALAAYEIAMEEVDKEFVLTKQCHLNLYSKTPDNLKQISYYPDQLLRGNNSNDIPQLPSGEPLWNVTYTPECINEIIRTANQSGFLVTYNHPAWSLENYHEYSQYEGMFAMEIYNTSSVVTDGMDDNNSRVYDDFLRMGKRIKCVAVDDNHDRNPIGHVANDSFGGFVVIRADDLKYENVIQALEKGNFYSSTGPAIHDLWYEDGEIHMTCSSVKNIILNTGCRVAEQYKANEGETLTSAVFHRFQNKYQYFRITIEDEKGNRAYTNAYFSEDLV